MPSDSRKRKRRRIAVFWIAVAAALFAAAVVVTLPGIKEAVEQVSDWAEGVINKHPVGGAAVFVLLSRLSAMLAFASTAVLVPVATEVWGKAVTFLLLWSGWMLGAIAAYAIGTFARPLLDRVGYEKKLKDSRNTSGSYPIV